MLISLQAVLAVPESSLLLIVNCKRPLKKYASLYSGSILIAFVKFLKAFLCFLFSLVNPKAIPLHTYANGISGAVSISSSHIFSASENLPLEINQKPYFYFKYLLN